MIQVVAFVRDALQAVFPVALWGSEHNRKLVWECEWTLRKERRSSTLTVVTSFVRARRSDVITLEAFACGFRLTDCEWLHPRGRVDRDSAIRRVEILHEWLYFVIDGFVMPLLKVHTAIIP